MLNHDKLWQELKEFVWEIKTTKDLGLKKHHHSGTDPYDNGVEIGSSTAYDEIYEKMIQLESL